MKWSHAFSRAWRKLHAFVSNSDWSIALFTSVVIGQSNYFRFGFTTLKWNRSKYDIIWGTIRYLPYPNSAQNSRDIFSSYGNKICRVAREENNTSQQTAQKVTNEK